MLKDYVLAKSVDDVLAELNTYAGKARIIAGGSDAMLDLNSGKLKTDCLIDITKIGELKKIDYMDGQIVIGAAVTHSEVKNSELIKTKAPLLSDASGSVGSLQIRNTATVVGNVLNAQPAADAAVALVALGAEAEIKDMTGTVYVPVEEMYAGVGKSTVDSTKQLVTAVKFSALVEGQGSAFVRLAQRGALALPMLNVAVVISLKEEKVEWVRIVMAPVAPKPIRARMAEKVLQNASVSEELIEEAARVACTEANPRNSALRGSAEYRKEVLEVLVKRALEQAISAAR
ncbi:molybdopterin dehydrogenase, FAD-binding protein [Desulforamulus reducens MI-1]|uniref:Molybdopterin dehydrogenase, FAD-binding protein n=1 Tax=Desulforamulus reducens (strain ATCC BAA-1160 / DSM 100696 / MI-1) TaxID=349161 RepID=A4J4M9_DESRM|nr:FAD binding domain-containing protein [Desulforamulus reducens]ABO50032.1 molybdopterin dehydrogenase, FAD-binding protein [Desulforamulus reducens MI-1]